MAARTVDIIEDGGAIALRWENGDVARFHAAWLRDNALDAATRSPGNGQRLISILDIPADTRVVRATIETGGDIAVTFGPATHETSFPAAWLAAHSYDHAPPGAPGWLAAGITPWTGGFQTHLPTAAFPAVSTDRSALASWLSAVKRYGFARLTDLPCRSGSLLDVVNLFGFVRETNYGRWFEVRTEVNPNNLAYTNLGLQAHTDNPYRDPIPTLQLLACLENSVEGGASVVVDGFAVVKRLLAENPRDVVLLSRHPARFDYAGSDGVRLCAKRPIIELGPDGEILAVRFNNRSAAPFTDIPFAEMADFYAAYRRFAELLEDPAMAVTFRLAPGDLFIVDNARVLHARKAFSSSGSRWLQGCYADRDGLLSTLAAILAAIPGETAGDSGAAGRVSQHIAPTRETIVDFLADIFERRGAESYLGEPVTLAEHMLQGAALAEREGAPDDLVVAALLHDIGHFTSEFGTYSPDDTEDRHHDDAGAAVLAPFFPPVVVECVRLHVAAKRYLCATDPAYFTQLSAASRHTLALQGGPMSPDEVAAFRRNPFHREAVRVRIWDEGGKAPDMRTRSFQAYAPLLRRVVEAQDRRSIP